MKLFTAATIMAAVHSSSRLVSIRAAEGQILRGDADKKEKKAKKTTVHVQQQQQQQQQHKRRFEDMDLDPDVEYTILEKDVQCDDGKGNGGPCPTETQANRAMGSKLWAIALEGKEGGGIYDIEGGLTAAEEEVVISGQTKVLGIGFTVNKWSGKARFSGRLNFAKPHGKGRNRKLAVTTGEKSFLVVRVVASDSTTGFSEAQLSDSVFGSGTDLNNLKSQYEACSYGALTVSPATGTNINHGVTTVTITHAVSGKSDAIIRNAVTSQLQSDFGVYPSNLADHVMYCLPQGTSGSWIAYAYIDFWLSVYNNQWCTYLSGQMHEIGHNLNLAHAGETATYDDQSCMMGYSYSSDDSPVMCFNAAKNWQLGWYSDKQQTLGTTSLPWTGDLYGIADYLQTPEGQNVILKLPGGTVDYYISFNRKTGINIGSMEGGNQVLVHSRPKGTGYAESDLLAKLSSGDDYSNQDLVVTVNSISTSTYPPGYANVCISQDGNCGTPDPTPLPTPPPRPSPTPVPTPPTTPAPAVQPTPVPTPSAPEWETIISDDFESGWGNNWVDGGEDTKGDARINSDTVYTSNKSAKSVRLQDNSMMDSSAYSRDLKSDIVTFDQLRLRYWYKVYSFDKPREDYFIEFSTASGTGGPWNEIKNFALCKDCDPSCDSDNTFCNDIAYPDTIVDLKDSDGEWLDLTSASEFRLRFRADASGNGDRLFIDDVVLEGVQSAGVASVGAADV